MSTEHPTGRTAPVLATVDLEVEGMTCASCVARVERRLGKIPGVTATVNLPLESAHVELTSDVPTSELIEAVEAAGYSARVVARESRADDGAASGHAGPGSSGEPARPGPGAHGPHGAGTPAHPARGHARGEHTGAGDHAGAGHDVEHALAGHSMEAHGDGPDADTSSPAERRGRDLRRRLVLAAWLTPV